MLPKIGRGLNTCLYFALPAPSLFPPGCEVRPNNFVFIWRFSLNRSCNTKSPVKEGYFGLVQTWADLPLFCFNDWSKVWRLALTSKMKILSWKFVESLLLDIPTNHISAILSYFFKQKSLKICCKKCKPGPTCRYFASMTEVKFEGLPWLQKWRYWAENSYVTYCWA